MLFQSFDLGAIRGCASLTVLASGKKISAPSRRCHGFAYFFDGHADYIYANTTLRVGPGSLLYLPMGVPYEIVRPELSHCIVFDFFAREDSAPQPPFCRTYELTALGDTFRTLWRTFSVKAENYLAECKSLFYKIVSIIQQYEIGSYLPSARYLRLLPAVEYLRANFASDEVSLATLAKIAGIGTKHFSQEFGKFFRLSPKQYLIRLRLSHAQELLLHSDLSILEIAISCGFKNEYYFSKLFKEKIGQTPSAYRAAHPF